MRFRAYLTTVLPANWKAVVDAFNEGYHVQGAHPQILPWTDDVSIAYEQYERHARYGRLENARRELRPSPRLGARRRRRRRGRDPGVARRRPRWRVPRRGAGDRRRAARRRASAAATLLEHYQKRRMELLAARGFDTSTLTPDRMTSAEDVYWFPNLVGPIYPGSAILFRVRPNGLDPDSAIKDIWVLEWRPPDDARPMPERKWYPDWTAKDWGEISNQDYANLAEVQIGMESRGFEGAPPQPPPGGQCPPHAPGDRPLPGDVAASRSSAGALFGFGSRRCRSRRRRGCRRRSPRPDPRCW